MNFKAAFDTIKQHGLSSDPEKVQEALRVVDETRVELTSAVTDLGSIREALVDRLAELGATPQPVRIVRRPRSRAIAAKP